MKVCVSLVPGGCCRVVLREAGGRVASARGARPGTPRRPSRGGGSRVGVAQGPAGGRTPRLSRDWRGTCAPPAADARAARGRIPRGWPGRPREGAWSHLVRLRATRAVRRGTARRLARARACARVSERVGLSSGGAPPRPDPPGPDHPRARGGPSGGAWRLVSTPLNDAGAGGAPHARCGKRCS